MTYRAHAAPQSRAFASEEFGRESSPHTAAPAMRTPMPSAFETQVQQKAAVTLGVALRYLAPGRAGLVTPRAPARRPSLRIVT